MLLKLLCKKLLVYLFVFLGCWGVVNMYNERLFVVGILFYKYIY